MALCHMQNSGKKRKKIGKRGEHDSWEKESSVFFLESVPGETEEMKNRVITSDHAVFTVRRIKKLAQTPQPGIHLTGGA